MTTYTISDLPPGLLRRAQARAKQDGTTLDAVLRSYLATYAAHGSPQAAGGRATAARRTAEERSASARAAARARWAGRRRT